MWLYILQFLAWTTGVALVLFAVSSFIVWFSSRRNAIENRVFESPMQLALRILAISQIIIFPLVLPLMILAIVVGGEGGIILDFNIAIWIAFVEPFSAILIFIFSFPFYNLVRRNDSTLIQSSLIRKLLYGLIGIIVPIYLFTYVGGEERQKFLNSVYSRVNSTALVELEITFEKNTTSQNKYNYRLDVLYQRLAGMKKDPTICHQIKQENYKNECYFEVDPEAAIAAKTCALFTKYGDKEFAMYKQAKCIESNLILDRALTDNPINCTAIQTQFKDNINITALLGTCWPVQILQKARLENNPAVCSYLLQNNTPYQFKYMACVGQFPNSEIFKSACQKYKYNNGFQEVATSQCPESRDYSHYSLEQELKSQTFTVFFSINNKYPYPILD